MKKECEECGREFSPETKGATLTCGPVCAKKKKDRNCFHERCKGEVYCCYSDAAIGEQRKTKGSQDQHYKTKALTKEWVVDSNKNVRYFNGTKIDKQQMSYRLVFFYVDEWSRKIEADCASIIETPVVNSILLKDEKNLTKDEINKLLSFAFIQSIRQLYPFDPIQADKHLKLFLYDNQYVNQVMEFKFEELAYNIHLPENGMINVFDFENKQFLQVLPLKPNRILVMLNKSPYVQLKDIKIDPLHLLHMSLGVPGNRVVLSEEMLDSEIKLIQNKNLKFYQDNNAKINEIVLNEGMVPLVFVALKELGIVPTKEQCYRDVLLLKNNPSTYGYICVLRSIVYSHRQNVSAEQFQKYLDEINFLTDKAKIDPDGANEFLKLLIGQCFQIDSTEVDSFLANEANKFLKKRS